MHQTFSRPQPSLRRHTKLIVACVLLIFASGTTLIAQVSGAPRAPSARLDSLRKLYLIPPVPVAPILVASFLGAPGSGLGTPAASGAGSNDYFVGVGYQVRTRFTKLPDGGFGTGAGFGDPDSGIALEVTASSFSTFRHPPFAVGGLSFKLHRRDTKHRLLYAVGVENATTWGLTDGGHSIYGVLSRVFILRNGDNARFGVLSTSLGVGNGRFRTQTEVTENRPTVGVFGGLGLRITSAVSLSTDWTGQDLDAGLTVTPFPGRGIVATIGYADLTRSAGDGPRLMMSIGYGISTHRDHRQLSPEDLNAQIIPR